MATLAVTPETRHEGRMTHGHRAWRPRGSDPERRHVELASYSRTTFWALLDFLVGSERKRNKKNFYRCFYIEPNMLSAKRRVVSARTRVAPRQ